LRIGQIGRIIGWIESTCTLWHTRLLLLSTAWSPSWYHTSGFLIALLLPAMRGVSSAAGCAAPGCARRDQPGAPGTARPA